MSLEQYLTPYPRRRRYAVEPAQAKTRKKPKKNNPKGERTEQKTNPCADCQRYKLYPLSCPWERAWEPVPGWVTEPSCLVSVTKRWKYVTDTWHILHCPLYIPPDRTNEQEGTEYE